MGLGVSMRMVVRVVVMMMDFHFQPEAGDAAAGLALRVQVDVLRQVKGGDGVFDLPSVEAQIQ